MPFSPGPAAVHGVFTNDRSRCLRGVDALDVVCVVYGAERVCVLTLQMTTVFC